MVVEFPPSSRTIDLVFHALSDPTRRSIVTEVLRSERSVSDLARRYPMSFAAVQKHVAVLERADLVHKRRCGREQLVSGNPDSLHAAHRALDQLEALWRERIDRMTTLLADPSESDPT